MSMHILRLGRHRGLIRQSERKPQPAAAPQQSGYKSQSLLSPATIGGVLLVHAGLGAAILTMTAVQVFQDHETPIWAWNIPKEEPKPVASQPPKAPATKTRSTASPQPTITLTRRQEDIATSPTITEWDFINTVGVGTGPVVDPVPLPEPAPPLLVQAKPDTRFASGFQPPYPAAMLRQQMEGAVTVRVTIGPDGRVLDVALVSAADPAFFEATRRQALNRWRFIPATRDGVPVTSERTMTVHFHLTD